MSKIIIECLFVYLCSQAFADDVLFAVFAKKLGELLKLVSFVPELCYTFLLWTSKFTSKNIFLYCHHF